MSALLVTTLIGTLAVQTPLMAIAQTVSNAPSVVGQNLESSNKSSLSDEEMQKIIKNSPNPNIILDKPFIKDTTIDTRREFTNPYNPENPNPDLSGYPTKPKRVFDNTVSVQCAKVYEYDGLLTQEEIDRKVVISTQFREVEIEGRQILRDKLKKYNEDLKLNNCPVRPFDPVIDKKEVDIITDTSKSDLQNILDFF